MVITLAQNRDSSFFTSQPSFPKCPSTAALLNSSSSLARRVSSPHRGATRVGPRLLRFCSRKCVPLPHTRRHLSVGVQQEQRVVFDPCGNAVLDRVFVRIHRIAIGASASCHAARPHGAPAILTLAMYSTSRGTPSGPTVQVFLPARFLQKSTPAFRNHRLETRLPQNHPDCGR